MAAIAAVSLWLSVGLVAVTGETSAARIIALPPWWLLAGILVLAIGLARRFQLRASRLFPLLLTFLVWLPFVPGHIPIAFLIWQGPIEVAVWAVAVVITLGPSVTFPASFTNPSRAPWLAAALTAIACAAGAAALRDQLPIGDEPHYLMMTESLIKDGDLRIENNHKNRDYQSFYKVDIPPHYLTRGKDGEIYSVHAPGVAVLVLPAFALFGYYGGVATVSACVALASAIAWHAAWLLTAQAAASWIAWAAVFLTAPVFLQSITVFPDAVGTLPVVAGVWALAVLDTRRRLSTPALLAVSIALATLPWFHSRFAILAAGLVLAIALRLAVTEWRRAAIFLAVPAVAWLLWLGFFWWIWGAATPAAPWGNGGLTAKAAWIPRGVFGLLFDPQAGVFIPAPAYLLAAAGWLMLLRSRPRLAIETLSILIALLLSVASYEAWWGGQGAPARYLVAGLPLALAAIAVGATMARTFAAILVTLSMFLLTAKVTAEDGAFAFNPERGSNPMLAWIAPSVDLSAWRLQPAASELWFVKSWRPSLSIASPASTVINIPADASVPKPTTAARLGDARVFFLDGRAYPEPTGFWVPGEGLTSVVMDLDDQSRSLGLRLQAGPVATSADVEINGERRAFSFAPRERHEIAVPPAAIGAWRITIRARAGFRPVDLDPNVKDYRNLGIWVEVF